MANKGKKSSSGMAGKIYTEGKRAAAFIAADKILEKIVSSAGEKIAEGIKVKLLGVGPNDEALYNEVKAFLDQPQKIRLADFVERMRREGCSFWWFRNVIATMQENFNETSKEKDITESPAYKILDAILSESNWEDQVKIAGPSLLVKSFKKRANDFWEIVKVGGEKIVIFPKDKLSKIDWCHVSEVIKSGGAEVGYLAKGMSIIFSGIVITILILGTVVFFLIQ